MQTIDASANLRSNPPPPVIERYQGRTIMRSVEGRKRRDAFTPGKATIFLVQASAVLGFQLSFHGGWSELEKEGGFG